MTDLTKGNALDQLTAGTKPPVVTKTTVRGTKASKEEKDRSHTSPPFNDPNPFIPDNGAYSASHRKVTFKLATNAGCYAMVKSKVVNRFTDQNGYAVILQSLENRGNIKVGDTFTYQGPQLISSTDKNEVNAGDVIASNGVVNGANSPNVSISLNRGGTSLDPTSIIGYTYGGTAGGPTGGSGAPSSVNDANGGSSGPQYTSDQVAKAAAFSTILSFPSAVNSVESNALTGQRSMLNDQELFPFIEQICTASLRSFMSMPNGKFYAFYPDYFGGFGRQPYWEINDIEIISGRIDLSDDKLATHVFVVGDTMPSQGGAFGFGNIDYVDEMQTTGVINIFNAFQAGFLNGAPTDSGGKGNAPDQLDKNGAINFLQKYGARRYYEPVSAVRSPIYETFLAFQRFCMLWSKQFQTAFEFTFMPELFPGGIVAFPEHGLQCYVEEVVHGGSYESGFTTQAVLSSPAALKSAGKDPDREWIHSGMIRAFVNGTVGAASPPPAGSGTQTAQGG